MQPHVEVYQSTHSRGEQFQDRQIKHAESGRDKFQTCEASHCPSKGEDRQQRDGTPAFLAHLGAPHTRRISGSEQQTRTGIQSAR